MTYQKLRSNRFLHIAAPALVAALVALPAIGFQGFPAGWKAKADRGSADAVQFTESGGMMHLNMGRVTASFYNPSWMKSGNYTYSARLTQEQKASHPVSYGIVIGGMGLDGATPMYTYFLVRQAGEYYIANWEGAGPKAVVAWTADPAINKEGADGKQENTLSVQVQGNNVIFSVNGKQVKTLQKSQVHTDGTLGFRVGHTLNVMVDQVKM